VNSNKRTVDSKDVANKLGNNMLRYTIHLSDSPMPSVSLSAMILSTRALRLL